MTYAVYEGFLQKMFKVKTKEEKASEAELRQLKDARRKVHEELEISMNNYNHVTEPGLMDFYIYKIRAQQEMESYLIGKIRKMEM